ncbi:O-methyltransferase [Mycena belliarum]|uniref:O-methyltransferase n=1 Tax=Mycena belliarum TaxID=1033014 RepID=A0AAD6XT41_9AGAR|nr:O-methyltransferase [Mycena belliae]
MAESLSTLRRLADIITQGVETMERVYGTAGMGLPELDHPFQREDPAEALREDPDIAGAVKNIMAAASQLMATVGDPVSMAINSAFAFHVPSCLRAASEINVVEILREGDPKGVRARDIAAPSGNDPDLVERILRLLATHHIFREVSPGVFANNRISSTLDKGKETATLFESREDRLDGTSGVAALVESAAENTFRASAFLADTLLHPTRGKLPCNLAFRTDEPWFKYMQRPENTYVRKRFAVAMKGTAATDSPEIILQGFRWGELPGGSIVVDVGGGIGHASMTIAQKHPTLRIVNQDLGPAVEQSRILFAAHDFFTPQPVKDAAVFLMRYVIHDWSNAQAISILTHLREAVTSTTKLVLLEKIVPSVAGDDLHHAIPGAARAQAAPPLLPNWGVASASTYMYDMTMHDLVGGVERTVNGFIEILKESGWKLAQIHHCPPSPLSHIVAIPV